MNAKPTSIPDYPLPTTVAGRQTSLLTKVVCLVATLLMLAGLTALSSQPASAAAGTDRLNPGERLYPGQRLTSADGGFSLVMQTDGNLVMLDRGSRVVWQTGTRGSKPFLGNQPGDGNIVLYSEAPSLHALWSTGPHSSNNTLVVQGDGNLVVYNIPTGQPLWSIGPHQNAAPCNIRLYLRMSKASGRPSNVTLTAEAVRKDCSTRTVTFSAASGSSTNQCARNVGWLPSGNYLVGTYHQRGHGTLVGRSEFHLDPVAGTPMCGRGGLALHSDAGVQVPSTRTSFSHVSNGCIKISGADLTTFKSMVDAYRSDGGNLIGLTVS